MAYVFALTVIFISLGAMILMLLFFIKAGQKREEQKQETIRMMLERGVYDRELIHPTKKSVAPLGWGIVFLATGMGMLIGFANLGILAQGAMGTAIVTFLGIALIVFYFVRRAIRAREANGSDKPIILPGAGSTTGGAEPGENSEL